MGRFVGTLMLQKYRDPTIPRWRRWFWGRQRWQLLDDFVYVTFDSDGLKHTIVAPVGMVTDGGTIPRICWWYVRPGNKKFLPAYVIHDIMCIRRDIYNRRFADDTFHDMLIELGCPVRKALLMFNAVKIYGN